MKKLSRLLLVALLLLASGIQAQNLNIQWSSRMTYSNFKDGFFDGFVGSSEDYVYGIMKDSEARFWRWNRNEAEMSLVAFDKETMQKSYQAHLKNKKKDKANFKKMKDYTYLKTIVLKEVVYVFWKKSTLTQSDIFAESFDVYLNRTGKLKKVYSVKHGATKKGEVKRRNRNAVGNLGGVPIVIQSGADSTNLMIGAEIQKGKDEPVEFDYVIVDTGFEELNKGHVKLPVVQVSRFNTSSAFTFEYGKDGNIYIKGFVRLSPAERKEAKKGEYSAYSILSVVDPKSAEIESYTMKYDGMNVFNFDLLTDENGVKLYGFFNDLSKDKTGSKTHGIFYATIQDGEITEPNFSYFDNKTLKELFKEDPSEKPGRTSRRKKQEKINKDESLDESYVIETAQAIDDDNIVLFCTKVYNYTTISCTSNGAGGGQTCVTNYYCRKSNVTAFKLDKEGDIVWASNVDREKTYSGWNIRDLKIIHDQEKFYVIYGSSFHTDAKRLSGKKAKKKKEIRDEFEYAVFDYESGKAKKNEYVVNAPKVDKKERKYISPTDIQVFDNKFFVNSTSMRLHPLVYVIPATLFVASAVFITLPYSFGFIATAVTSLTYFAALPIGMRVWAKGYVYKGAGHMGSIELPEKKESKSKKGK